MASVQGVLYGGIKGEGMGGGGQGVEEESNNFLKSIKKAIN